MNFHENLRFIMEVKDIQIKELSSKTGISENTIKTYLRSASAEPKLSKALVIAKALETTVEDLCEEKTEQAHEDFRFNATFSALSENDKKSVMALMNEMARHYWRENPLAFTKTELEEDLNFANTVASICVTRRGAIPALPTLEEVNAF